MTRTYRNYRFETRTAMEELEMNSNSYGAVLKYGNKVILAVMNYKSETLAAVYESRGGHLGIEIEMTAENEDGFRWTGWRIKAALPDTQPSSDGSFLFLIVYSFVSGQSHITNINPTSEQSHK